MQIELTDQEFQQLLYVLANAHGPNINWLLTNGLLSRLREQATNAASFPAPNTPHFPEAGPVEPIRKRSP